MYRLAPKKTKKNNTMTKAKITALMTALMMTLSAFSLSIEEGGMEHAYTSVLGAESSAVVEQVAVVKRPEKVEVFSQNDFRNFKNPTGIVNTDRVIKAAERDMQQLELRFEDLN